MKKIISLFQRNHDGDRLVRDEVTPGAEWVLAGEGLATVKYDGTACIIRYGELFRRYDRKSGRAAPDGWEPCELVPDPNTGHWPGWVPVGDGPEDQYHREALFNTLPDGPYELCGPKVQGNPHRLTYHILRPHGHACLPIAALNYDAIREHLRHAHIEGIVWHHADGRMVKIKRRDFGLEWPVEEA